MLSNRKYVVLSLLLVAATVLAGCAPVIAPTQAAAPAAAPTQAPVPAPTAVPTSAPTVLAATAPAQPTSGAASATIELGQSKQFGSILTDSSKGMTLYLFTKDKPGESACTDACAQIWPPLTIAQGAAPVAGTGLTAKLGTIQRADGTMQVTYNDHPLYFYAKDTKPGDVTGQGLNDAWYVVDAAGAQVTGVAAAGTPSGSTSPAAAATPAGAAASGTVGAAGTPSGSTTPATAATPIGPTLATPGTPSANSQAAGKIALLLPETKTTRYETADRPDFEAKLKALCPNCQIIYSNANQDATAQLAQAEAALTNGAQVLVFDPVDSKSAATIADKAKAQGVPVIAYDRLILNSDGVNYYISFDNEKVGQLQAQSLVDQLNKLGKQNPQIVMINGAPTDNNAKLFKQGAHSVFDPLVKAGKLTIAKEYDTPDWSPDQAQNEMQQALTALGNKVDGVYAANDGTASGAIAAMKAAGLTPLPPITGQDAELSAIQRILTGEQYMTVYKAIKPEAEAAAQLAYDLVTKAAVPAGITNGATVNNGKMDVPSVLLTPVAVTKDNVKDTVVKDAFWTAQQICTSAYAGVCKAAGLQP
jgi:D-xylose transport system substrate-binding protein